MGIQIPLKNIKSITDTATSSTVSYPFLIPQDTTGVVVRVYTGATFSGTSPTADVYFQTSEDGGTTWRDCVHFTQITAARSLQNAEFQPVPVIGITGTVGTSGFTSSVAASTLAASKVSGLPILSQQNRIFLSYGGTIGTNSGINVDVLANSQDPHI